MVRAVNKNNSINNLHIITTMKIFRVAKYKIKKQEINRIIKKAYLKVNKKILLKLSMNN